MRIWNYSREASGKWWKVNKRDEKRRQYETEKDEKLSKENGEIRREEERKKEEKEWKEERKRIRCGRNDKKGKGYGNNEEKKMEIDR